MIGKMIASDYIGGLVIVLGIVAIWLLGFFYTMHEHNKEIKQRSSLEKIAILLQYEGASITKSEAFTLAFSRLVNEFYLSLDSEMKRYELEDTYASFAEKLESNQGFRRRQIAVIMGVIMGCICSSSQHGKKKSAVVFWADEIKKTSIDEKDLAITKKAYNASVRWCADGLDPYDSNGGFVVNYMLGHYNEASVKDMPDLAQMTILLKGVQETIKTYRLVVGTAIMAGEYK